MTAGTSGCKSFVDPHIVIRRDKNRAEAEQHVVEALPARRLAWWFWVQDVLVRDGGILFVLAIVRASESFADGYKMADLVKVAVGEVTLSNEPEEAIVGKVLPAGTSRQNRCACSS